jgi:hypothetical protein
MTVVQPTLPLGEGTHIRRANVGPGAGGLDDDIVWRAISLIDDSPLVETITAWKREERKGPGGRPETFPVRALLVAMLICAVTNQPMLATRFSDIMFRQVSPTMRHALGVPKPPGPLDRKGWDDVYRNVRTRLHGLMTLMDPSPAPKNRRRHDLEFAELLERHRQDLSAEQWTERAERLTWFINQVLEMSIRTLPRDIRRQWKGSAAVDATVIPAFARPDRREKRKKRGVTPTVITHSSDPDADWYHRGERIGRDGETESAFSVWGYEATFAVSGADDPNEPHTVPSLVIGMAPLHKPGTRVGQNAIVALSNIHDRGHPAHFLAADRAYTNAKPEDFQLPARALGYQLVLDYKIDQLGNQGSFQGMVQVDGAWYCPGMSESLVNATRDFRNGLIDEETYRARLAERWKHAVLNKERPDDQGHLRLRCPASNPNPVVRCALKPKSEGPATRGKPRIPVTDALRSHTPKICTQQSITVPPEAGAKFSQTLLHESEEWQAVYGTLRNSVEGMNGFIKDGAREAVDDPERRRIRGVAPQSVFVAFLLCAANLRKIEAYLAEEEAVASGSVRRLPSRRTTKSIAEFLPQPAALAGADDEPLGPDPPIIA